VYYTNSTPRQETPEYTINPQIFKSGADQIRHCTTGSGPHDPRGNPFTKSTDWSLGHWDGIPYDITGKTKAEIHAWLRPNYPANQYAIRGLEEYFYQVNPFADNNNPTVAEIDTWNLNVIRHIRRVLGIKIKTGSQAGQPMPIIPDPRLYVEAAWSQERKMSTTWDTLHPNGVIKNGTEYFGFAPGPCWLPGSNGTVRPTGYTPHCGETFFPTAAQSLPYRTSAPYNLTFDSSWGLDSYNTLPPNDPRRYIRSNYYNALKAAKTPYIELYEHGTGATFSSGTSGTSRNIPWSHRLAIIITNFIKDEGTTGHAGPYFDRPYIGMAWTCFNDGGISYRAKYAGRFRADNGELSPPPFLGWTNTGT
jgi:hypothetical protein